MAQMQAKSSQGSGAPELRKVVDNQSVGEILRNGRLALGEDLSEVAEGLKIRRAFIEALENDEFGALPGTAYGIGFARAYADYLDLDTNEVVELFKAQSRAFNDQTQLVFPEPMPGSRVPTSLVIILSLLLVGAAYGGWTVLSDENRSLSDLVPPVPEFLSTLQESASEVIAEEAPPEQSATSTVEDAASAVQEQAVVVAEPVVETVSGNETGAATVAEETGEPVSEAAAVVSDDVTEAVAAVEAPAAQSEPVVEPVAELQAIEPEPAIAPAVEENAAESIVGSDVQTEPADESLAVATEAAESVAGETVVSADNAIEPAAADATVEAVDAAVADSDVAIESETAIDSTEATVAAIIPEAPSNDVTIYGETEGASRVSVVARQATWVEISDSEGTVLLTRLLLKGDIYKAPDQAGLTLVTGNAGGLEFRVDGETVQDIGPVGSVRRDVSLSPEALQAGTAAPVE